MKYPGIDEFLDALLPEGAPRRRSTRSASTCRRSTTRSARCSSRRSTRTKSLDHKTLAQVPAHERDEDHRRPDQLRTRTASGPSPRVLMAQFRGVRDKDVEQFRQPGKQVIVYPHAVQDRRRRSCRSTRRARRSRQTRRRMKDGAAIPRRFLAHGILRSICCSKRCSSACCSAASTPR